MKAHYSVQRTCHWFLSWERWIQRTPSHFNIILLSKPRDPKWLCPSDFLLNFVWISMYSTCKLQLNKLPSSFLNGYYEPLVVDVIAFNSTNLYQILNVMWKYDFNTQVLMSNTFSVTRNLYHNLFFFLQIKAKYN